MSKTLFSFVFIALFSTCNLKNKKKDSFTIDKTDISDTTISESIKLKIVLLEKKVQSISHMPDSISSYIKLNYSLYDSLKKWGNSERAGKYLDNIITHHKEIVNDTSLKKILAKAYVWWSFDRYSEKYNDTVVERFERFIMLSKYQKPENILNPYVYQQLAIQYNVLGDLKKCSYYNNLVYSYAKNSIKADWHASSIINYSIVLNETGFFDSTISIINNVLLEKGISPKKKAILFGSLAEAQAGKSLFTESIITAKKSIYLLEKLTSNEIDATSLYEKKAQLFWTIGKIQLAAKKLEDAKKNLETASSYLSLSKQGNTKNRETGKIFITLGNLYEKLNEKEKSLKFYHKALSCVTSVDSNNIFSLPLKTQLYLENTIIEALDAKANVLQQKFKQTADAKYLTAAINCYKISFEVERKLMQNFSYDESRMLMLKESKKRSEQAIAICYNLFITTKNNNWANEAFLFAEKSKAFVLLESVKRNIASNTILQNDSNYQRIQYLNARIAFLDKETILLDGDKADSLKAVYDKQKTTLNNELLLANNELSRNNAAYQILNNKEDSLSIVLAQQNILDNNTAFIEFFAGDSSTYIFSFTKNTNCTFFKTTDTIAKTLNNFLSFFTDKNKINNNPTAYQAAAHTLYTQLNFAAIDTSAITKYIIIPDGGFNLLPVEALVTTIKKENNPKYFDYVLLHKQINYNYSAATILKQMEYQGNISNNTTTCFAPVFANNERGNTPLLHTIKEFAAIKKETNNGQYFLQQQATIGNFKKQLKTAGIVHIATHANANVANGIQQPQIEFYDSTLYLNELYAMHINPNLVVLSACQTGIGEIDKSEGAMSLARGFYYAGAKNIITSLWSVHDKSTASIFSNFYQQLAHTNYNSSLHNAKLNYLKNTTAVNASPYYWAGFVHIGYQMPPAKSNYFYFLGIGFFLLLLFILWYFKNKKTTFL